MSEMDFGDPVKPTLWQENLGLSSRECHLAVLRAGDRRLIHFGGGLDQLLIETTGPHEAMISMDQSKAKFEVLKRKKNSGTTTRTKLEALADVEKRHRSDLQRDSKSIVRLLSGITSLPIRLTALENIFSLLFLSKYHMIGGLKNDELKRSAAANMAPENSWLLSDDGQALRSEVTLSSPFLVSLILSNSSKKMIGFIV